MLSLPRNFGHNHDMTELLERAMKAVQSLPPKMQDDVARAMLMLAGEDRTVIQLTPEEEASFAEAYGQLDRREFASDERMQAIWSKPLA